MDDCIFCKIVAGEIPCQRLAESENWLAFLDISPVAEGHTLLIPKQHSTNVLDMPEYLGNELLEMAQRVGNAVVQAVKADGFNFTTNNGKAAGQEVFHVHFHLIPRREKDGLVMWPQQPADARVPLEETHKKILESLG